MSKYVGVYPQPACTWPTAEMAKLVAPHTCHTYVCLQISFTFCCQVKYRGVGWAAIRPGHNAEPEPVCCILMEVALYTAWDMVQQVRASKWQPTQFAMKTRGCGNKGYCRGEDLFLLRIVPLGGKANFFLQLCTNALHIPHICLQ